MNDAIAWNLDATDAPNIARIEAGLKANQTLRNEIAGSADMADTLADRLTNLANRSRELAGELRAASVEGAAA